MTGTFYVFCKWASTADNNLAAKWGRYQIALPSRSTADELFRAMQEMPAKNGKGNHFTVLTRESPQFWVYDSPDGWPSMINIQVYNYLPAFRDRFSVMLLSDWDGVRNWPVIAPSSHVNNLEHAHGGEFFIRNVRQPEIYWYKHADGDVVTSTTRRTKFRITKTGDDVEQRPKPLVLIKSDVVRLDALGDGAAAWMIDGKTLKEVLTMGVQYRSAGLENRIVSVEEGGDAWELC
ncbi:hypothetical protein EDC01DRAFT_725800 [Geopyxis carbonaria]|nr:hypothetical protein EDC01DRAFT_725800 [Geopyxis carbonaria]